MPKTDIDYSKGVIYKIVSDDLTVKECYVGSTTNFTKRKNNHKYACHNDKAKEHNQNVYKFIREHSGWGNWSMVLVQNYPCNSKLELLARERHHTERLNATLNKQVQGRTVKDSQKVSYENNKHKIIEKAREYYRVNKEAVKIRDSEIRSCVCGKLFTHHHQKRHEQSKRHTDFVNRYEIIY